MNRPSLMNRSPARDATSIVDPATPSDADVDPSALPLERLRFVYQLTDAVSRARGIPEIYEAALDGLLRALSADRASILLFDADGVMRFKAWRGLSDAYRAAVEGHSPWGPDAVDAEPIVVPDVLADPDWEGYRAVFEAEGIRSLGFIPLASRGRLIGKFMVYFAAPHRFDEEEIRLARAIAGHIGFAVDRARREEKLALYHEIFAHSSDAIAILGIDGVYREQNAAHRTLLGYDDSDLVGRTPAIHMGEARYAQVARAMGEGGSFRDEVTSTTRSGLSRDIELSAFTVRDDAGDPVCHVGVKRDVTERKRTEEALTFLAAASAALDRSLDYEETLRALGTLAVPFLGDWALVETLDGEGRRARAFGVHRDARRGATLAGLAAARAGGSSASPATFASARRVPIAELIGDQAGPEGIALLAELGGHSALEAPLRARGRLLGMLTVVSARETFGDREVALAEDLGRRAAIALDNARLYGEAQESDRRKEEFLAVLAHELRNPLMPLLTCLELMKTDEDRSRGPSHQEIMERQVRNLKRLVDDLLEVSRVTRGKIELRKHPVSLATVVARAIETIRPMVSGHRLTVAVDPAIRLEADPLRLEQVLANLLGNASKYTPPGGGIEVRGSQVDGWVELGVRDDGAGISPEILPRVFDLFVQGGRTAGGLGVGLTLVRTLVEMHGGTVKAASGGPGLGSQFVVRLPVGSLEEPGATERDLPHVRPLRVLLVDDNVDATRMLCEALRIRGHDVAAAHDGRSALALAAHRAPDVVLLDLGLPDMDGYEVARNLRSDPALAAIPIVALSGYDQEQFRERSRAAGLEHVVKPVDLDQLDRILASATGARGEAAERA